MQPKKKNAQPERLLQTACTQWLELQRRARKLTYFAVPNGGYRRKLEGWILQKMGVRAGIPDMVVAWFPAKVLFIEFKSGAGYASAVQKDMHEELRFFGFNVFIIRSLDDMIRVITEQKGTTT